jgi:type II secretory pathway pseudopilin PulG
MKNRRSGMTLVETAIAMGVIAIAALGGLSYQYYSTRQIRVASVMLSGMRVGQMLLEDWKGKAAADDYDPTVLGLGFTKDPIANNYNLTMDGQKYYIWLDHIDIATDPVTDITLREIKCTIRWQADSTKTALATSDPTSVFSTYVRMGQD